MADLDPGGALVLTVTPIPPTATKLYLSRTGPSGQAAYVRGYNPFTFTAGQTEIIVRDYEAPLGVPLTYTGTFDVAGSYTNSLTIVHETCEFWLVDLAQSANSQVVTVESLAELEYDVPAGVHQVLARRAPIVVSDAAHTPTFELDFLTVTDDQRDRARAALGNGVPVLLRTPPEQGIGNLYLSVTNFKEQRIVTSGTVQDRRFAVSGVQVERPDPALYVPTGPATYESVKATYATYAALNAGRASYDAVLYDYSGTTPVDVIPWPPRDV
jgi:hypothetical protein